MSSGPDDRSTLTVKFGKDFDAPWFVASGTPQVIRRQLVEFAGITDDPEKTLQQLAIEVASETQAMWAVRSKLGGKPQSIPSSKAKAAASTDDATSTEAAEVAAPAKDEDPNAFIFELIAEAGSVDALKRVYAKNKDAFNKTKALQTAFAERKNALA